MLHRRLKVIPPESSEGATLKETHMFLNEARRVRVRVIGAFTQVNRIGGHLPAQLDWTKLPFMDGLTVAELPNDVLIRATSVLRAMQSNFSMWTYWDAFDRGRRWDDERFDGYFVVPKQSCRIIMSLDERRATKTQKKRHKR